MVINHFRGLPDKFTFFRNQSLCFLIFIDIHEVLKVKMITYSYIRPKEARAMFKFLFPDIQFIRPLVFDLRFGFKNYYVCNNLLLQVI